MFIIHSRGNSGRVLIIKRLTWLDCGRNNQWTLSRRCRAWFVLGNQLSPRSFSRVSFPISLQSAVEGGTHSFSLFPPPSYGEAIWRVTAIDAMVRWVVISMWYVLLPTLDGYVCSSFFCRSFSPCSDGWFDGWSFCFLFMIMSGLKVRGKLVQLEFKHSFTCHTITVIWKKTKTKKTMSVLNDWKFEQKQALEPDSLING